jgi:uridine phosphorylase
MAYPNFKNKHLEEALILPDHNGKSRKKFEGKIPRKCIITYQNEAFKYLLKKYKSKAKKLKAKGLWGCDAYYTKEFVFVYVLGVGAPHTAIVLEELIALGMNQFLNIGIAGGLQKWGFFICEKSIRDEGTSAHYVSHTKYAYPDNELTEKLENSFVKYGIQYTKGTNWTIDAPFRETKTEIKEYRAEGVVTVEMEASALFVVAKVRGVKIAAAFVTSDFLGEKWENRYAGDKKFVGNGLRTLAKLAVNSFSD